ncbi:gamma-glutamylaminecyclotransferase-like isoform X2 [Adelges cooleyi]|uniref:gamma-glutamylaminecyclotransferase-like isoform X2 n=1 Tax=Adelges cooleyi TaxID=133065 RepID=UPI00217F3632|nr:gamma-glutamylaminecyclotransferase-like isoform X2 [Adelges cooleyi]XP_050423494.1 gamma-glutamylaminecyclotransferase-like isoform X2 [Adelges cooleyi]
MEKVFVYGTLKRNQPNHDVLNDGKNGKATFLAEANTIQKYPLVISTKYNIPFLLHKASTGHLINGEIYNVDTKMLAFLDEFENHPNFYVRQKTCVKLTNDDIVECWIYFLTNYPDNFLQLKYFSDYDSSGTHGLAYVSSEEMTLLEV